MSSAEKTEPASPRKLRRARRRGEVWRSRDLASAAVLLAGAAVLALRGPAMVESLTALGRTLFAAAVAASPPAPALALEAGLATVVACLWPLLVAVVLAAAAAGLATVRPLLTLEPLAPRLGRLDPIRGLGRLVSPRSLVEAILAALKVLLLAVVLVWTASSELATLAALAVAEPRVAGAAIGHLAIALLWRGALVLAALSIVDVLYQRHRYLKDQRMTKQEVKQESRETEGDGSQKGERRRLHAELLEDAMLHRVRTADVVIVNPDHLAVALRYDPDEEDDAPLVIAAGRNLLAARIVAEARRHGVPVLREVELARSLVGVELGSQIPEELYEAVAEILKVVVRHVDREL